MCRHCTPKAAALKQHPPVSEGEGAGIVEEEVVHKEEVEKQKHAKEEEEKEGEGEEEREEEEEEEDVKEEFLFGERHWMVLFGALAAAFASLIVPTNLSTQQPGRVPMEHVPVMPTEMVSFTVHENGNGLSEGIATSSAEWESLDGMILKTCMGLTNKTRSECMPSHGARLITHNGCRVFQFSDIREGQRTYVVPQGLHFTWPLGKVGSTIIAECVKPPVEGKPVRLVQLSMSPRAFSVENLMNVEEMLEIYEHNKELVTPSEVGFAGWRDNTRTSSTSWDSVTTSARVVQNRSFELLAMDADPGMADALQVLRYEKDEWYKPHTDWFDGKAYDGHDPTVNNGTNRFATVFLYLSDVEEGGHTVFPLSTTHEGYNGERLVHPGTEKTAGYIANKDARWCCNTSSTALRSKPVAGNAVLFYGQLPDGTLDKYSLHGGCPPIRGTKWSANVWVWNRPTADKSKAKDAKDAPEGHKPNDGGIDIIFENTSDETIDSFWVSVATGELVPQPEIGPYEAGPMHTFPGHTFVFKNRAGETIKKYVAKPKDCDATIIVA